IHPRGQRQRRLKGLLGDRLQELSLGFPDLTNTVGAVSDPTMIVSVISSGQHRVELVEGVDHRHRHAVVASEPAAFAFHTALLVAAVMTGLAIPGFKTEVRPERDPAL